ncbi:12-oxophytodienoate reductase, partial [Paenibacillus sepulcri]|nr:12-oxophytodienoate reductase [Paenibacillus sepulcri]
RVITGKPVITVGSVGLDDEFMSSLMPGKVTGTTGIEDLIERLSHNEFDLVAVGRSLLADPEWVMKVRGGRWEELNPFTSDALKTLI